jgi:gamma-glutamyltranspeptidase
VEGLNASGRSPQKLTLERCLSDLTKQQTDDDDVDDADGKQSATTKAADINNDTKKADTKKAGMALHAPPPLSGVTSTIPFTSPHAITVPGACAGWCEAVERYGSGMPLPHVLAPAIQLAENGFPIGQMTSECWRDAESLLVRQNGGDCAMLLPGRESKGERKRTCAPCAGEIFRNPGLAATFRKVAKEGRKGFYEGRIGRAIVEAVQSRGGVMELEDLKAHRCQHIAKPIKATYKGGNPLPKVPLFVVSAHTAQHLTLAFVFAVA